LTGRSDEQFAVSAVASGAQEYLVKGRVDADMLWRALRYAIERKRAELTAVELRASLVRPARPRAQTGPGRLRDPG
jgi:ActR/RegA family two-component response regulator